MKNRWYFCIASLVCIALSACHATQNNEIAPVNDKIADLNTEVVYPIDQRYIRTPDGANALDLETPLRCNVNWETQQLILTLKLSLSLKLLKE